MFLKGIIEGEKSIVEVKCVYSLVEKNYNFVDAAKILKHFCLQYNENTKTLTLKKNHHYYYQVIFKLMFYTKSLIIILDSRSAAYNSK